jgi:preprotein translocase subunit SecA
MSQTLTHYNSLYESLRSRRLRPELPKGIDMIASRIGTSVKHRSTNLANLRRQAEATDRLAPELRSMSEAALDDYIARTREVFVRGRQDFAAVSRGLASIREVARRITGEEAYLVQLTGALGLYHGRIIEMLTGEGKTLTGSIAAPLIAWQHKHLHILTVNDYLASRDALSRKAIYQRCLCDVGAIVQDTEPAERYGIYSKQIIYCTPKQIVADFLRDQIRMGQHNTPWSARHLFALTGSDGDRGPMVPGLQAAMVDEADAVLIDEGVVPLIIARSRREDDMANVYREAADLATRLDEGPDYVMDLVQRRCDLKRRGSDRLRHMFAQLIGRGGSPIWKAHRRGEELIRQALVARFCYLNQQQYQIVEGKIVIVDEYTGRFLPDRSWEHGLHQAVEAKEALDVTADRETLARLSFQRYFRTYPFLCGMTGTAADATGEMEAVYSRPVTVIPTNRPIARVQMPMRIFRTQRDKWAAIVNSIEEIHNQGRPILAGTRSIASSELLSNLLKARGLAHEVLNANYDKDEADLISRAGQGRSRDQADRSAAITVATNMAGRGTDIKLDKAAREAGGLHVLLTEMHGAKRIDRQFIGRAGRQGDPGSSQIFVSLEDELVTKFASLAARILKERPGHPEFSSTGLLGRLFRHAQGRSEAKDRRNRAAVLKQDDWIDKHLPGVG